MAFVGAVLTVAAGALYATASWERIGPVLGFPAVERTSAAMVEEVPLLRPSASEIALTRARALYEAGRLHDALGMLSRVRPISTFRAEADALETVIQRALVAAAARESR